MERGKSRHAPGIRLRLHHVRRPEDQVDGVGTPVRVERVGAFGARVEAVDFADLQGAGGLWGGKGVVCGGGKEERGVVAVDEVEGVGGCGGGDWCEEGDEEEGMERVSHDLGVRVEE